MTFCLCVHRTGCWCLWQVRQSRTSFNNQKQTCRWEENWSLNPVQYFFSERRKCFHNINHKHKEKRTDRIGDCWSFHNECRRWCFLFHNKLNDAQCCKMPKRMLQRPSAASTATTLMLQAALLGALLTFVGAKGLSVISGKGKGHGKWSKHTLTARDAIGKGQRKERWQWWQNRHILCIPCSRKWSLHFQLSGKCEWIHSSSCVFLFFALLQHPHSFCWSHQDDQLHSL